jgi:dinuclear metal center YbgI/SA1388 family protein
MPERKTRVGDVISVLRSIAPEEHALSWDRVGLEIGDPAAKVNRILVALELTDQVVTAAIRQKADLLVLHHPVIFEPLQHLREDSASGKRIAALIRKSIAVYVMHTNFDASPHSMSTEMLRRLGVEKPEPVVRKPNVGNVKIVVFCPRDHTNRIRTAMGDAGAGVIGEYDLCSFLTPGTGSFRGSDATDPFIGKAGKFELAEEDRLEMICPRSKVSAVVTAMVRAHPYEEPAYDIYPLQDFLTDEHFIWIGDLTKAKALDEVASTASKEIAGGCPVRVIGSARKHVRRLAAASGGGKSLIDRLSGLDIDCFVTGEIDHHAARRVEDLGVAVIAVGHYESEVAFGPIVARLLRKSLPDAKVGASRALRQPFRSVGG